MNSARLKGDHASNPDLYAAELRHDRVIALMLSFPNQIVFRHPVPSLASMERLWVPEQKQERVIISSPYPQMLPPYGRLSSRNGETSRAVARFGPAPLSGLEPWILWVRVSPCPMLDVRPICSICTISNTNEKARKPPVTNRRAERPGGEHAWVLAAAIAVIALVFAWIMIPAIFAGNPFSKALLPLLKMAGSVLAAFAGIGALKLYLEKKRWRERQNDPVPLKNRSYQPQRAPYASRVKPDTTYSQQKGHTVPQPNSSRVEWSLELLRSLEWKRFEDLCDEYSKTKGMRTQTTRLGADGGIDIRIYRETGDPMGVIQCKAWKKDIGVKLIRELAGVMAHEKVKNGVFITTSSFTPDATVFAAANGIILLDGKEFLNAIKTLPASDQEHLLTFATSGDYTTPTCAKCGVKMVLKNGYSEFWGCPNYPRCRETIRIRGGGRK